MQFPSPSLLHSLDLSKIDRVTYNNINYKGFWFQPIHLEGILSCQKHFQAQNSDFCIATMPKSGTTWLKSLVFVLVNRANYQITKRNHPLLTKNPHELVPFLEIPLYGYNQVPELDSLSSPRLFATHIPFSLLPDCIKDSPLKIVYLWRDPKDTFVSYWHFIQKMCPERILPLEVLFEQFSKGENMFGPSWDHILGYWNASIEKHDKVWFMRYEEMKKDPVVQVRKLAEFLCCPITKDEDASNFIDEILELCSFDHLSRLEVNNKSGWYCGMNNRIYFRRGEVGDWKNYLTSEMADRLDKVTEEKLKGSGIIL